MPNITSFMPLGISRVARFALGLSAITPRYFAVFCCPLGHLPRMVNGIGPNTWLWVFVKGEPGKKWLDLLPRMEAVAPALLDLLPRMAAAAPGPWQSS